MPLIIFILIVLLIAQVGFWHALGAILGAFVMIALLIILGVAILVLGGMWLAGLMSRPRRFERDGWR